MPKVKVPRKSTAVDMTAMTDVAFLLLTFFMLTTKFRPDEPVMVDSPMSFTETKVKEEGVLQILVDQKGRVFVTADGADAREKIAKSLQDRYKITLTANQMENFKNTETIGCPISDLPAYLDLKREQRTDFDKTSKGIPIDSADNQLGDWLKSAYMANNNYQVVIKGDRNTQLDKVKRIFEILQDNKMNKINFITSLEARPKI